jgi:hypothetical protein
MDNAVFRFFSSFFRTHSLAQKSAVVNGFVILSIGISVCFLVLTRLVWLDRIPAALTHDEIMYALQAQSFVVQGKTIVDHFFPWQLQPAHAWYAELPSVMMTPFFVAFRNVLIATRAGWAFMSIFFPFAMAGLSYGIWRNRNVAIATAFLTGGSPLQWQFGRLAYDAYFTAFFYIAGGALLLIPRAHKWLGWLGVLSLCVGFFGYQGYKILFPFWVFAIYVLSMLREGQQQSKFQLSKLATVGKLHTRTHLFWQVTALAIFFLWFVLIHFPTQNTGSRFSTLLNQLTVTIPAQVNDSRRQSLLSGTTAWFDNRHVVLAQSVIEKILRGYDPIMLFVRGERDPSFFSAWGHGWFYLVDALLLFLGITVLLQKKKQALSFVVLLSMIVLGHLPSILNTGKTWFFPRLLLSHTLLLLIIGWGVEMLHTRPRRLLVGTLYLVSVLFFMYHASVRFPILGLQGHPLSKRIIAEYIRRAQLRAPNQRFLVFEDDPPLQFSSYLLYTHALTQKTTESVRQAFLTEQYQLNGVVFDNHCLNLPLVANETLIAHTLIQPCVSSANVPLQRNRVLTIPDIITNGAMFRVHHDLLCHDAHVAEVIHPTKRSQLDLSSLSDQDFCQTWFSLQTSEVL